MGLLFGLLAKRGPSFVDHVWESAVAGGWGEHAELLIVKALPTGPATWSRIIARSPSLDRAYRTTLNVPTIPKGADLDQATAKLVEAGRGRDAVDLLGSRLAEKPSGDALVRACCAAIKDGSAQASSDTMFTFFLGKYWIGLKLINLRPMPRSPPSSGAIFRSFAIRRGHQNLCKNRWRRTQHSSSTL